MRTVLLCAACSGGGVAGVLGLGWLLLMYGSDRIGQALIDVGP